jgi:hypothetical protein
MIRPGVKFQKRISSFQDSVQGNNHIERFHRSLREKEVGLAEYRNLEDARENIARYL